MAITVAASPAYGVTTIMPLGDSITEGPAPVVGGYLYNGGYRLKLWQNFGSDPNRIDFVGSVQNGGDALGDKDHEGHGGYTIDMVNDYLDKDDGSNNGCWLTGTGDREAVYPDIILLHVGDNNITSDVTTTAGKLDTLVGHIFELRPTTKLIVASLIPRSDTLDTWIQQYNAEIPDIVEKYQSLGNTCYFVDMHDKLTSSDISTDCVHPLQSGYDKMGDAWYEAIQSVPEPSSIIMSGISIIGLLAYAWRKRR